MGQNSSSGTGSSMNVTVRGCRSRRSLCSSSHCETRVAIIPVDLGQQGRVGAQLTTHRPLPHAGTAATELALVQLDERALPVFGHLAPGTDGLDVPRHAATALETDGPAEDLAHVVTHDEDAVVPQEDHGLVAHRRC